MAGFGEFEKSQYILVNGKQMLLSEYKKKVQTKKKAKRVSRKAVDGFAGATQYIDVSTLASEVDKLVKSAAPFKSLSVFYSHAYRSYGKVSEEIMKPYSREYVEYQRAYRTMNETIDIMHDCAKKRENEVYDFAIQLTWKLDNMREKLNKLVNKVKDHKEVTERLYKGQPVYEGRMLGGKAPRELGFKHQLFSQSPLKISKTFDKLEECVNTIKRWGENGRNPFDYKL